MSSRGGLYLHWEGKRFYRQRVPKPRLLKPMPELSFGENYQNMIVEGDNFQAMASLRSRYENQVDVVYIDPPYNLGTNDFRYSDKRFHDPDADDSDAVYVTNKEGNRHTKWLNFMASRLYMLSLLLKQDTGIIFVSINDIELFRMGMLLNEIFGEENWLGTLIWHGTTDNNQTRITMEHEYILCYSNHSKKGVPPRWRSINNEVQKLLLDTFKQFKAEATSLEEVEKKFLAFCKENKTVLGDLYRYRNIDDKGPHVFRRNLDNPGKLGHTYEVLHPDTHKPCMMPRWGWRFTKESMDELIAEKRIRFGKDEKQIPQLKFYLEDVEFPLRSVIDDIDARTGSNDLETLFGARDKFKNPKPVALIERLLDYSTKPDSLILDAFAGSGTTAEAIMKLNQRDGGNRRYILIEEGQGSDRFCRTLTAERVKRAIIHYGYQSGFTFYTADKKLDREAILGLERDSLANLICQADETGLGRGISRLNGHKYIIGKNHRSEAICLVWNGKIENEVTEEHLYEAAEEVEKAGLKEPFRIYGTFCRVQDTPYWKFCQIPDEILVQMHIQEDVEGED